MPKTSAFDFLEAHAVYVVALAEKASQEENEILCDEILILSRRLKAACDTYREKKGGHAWPTTAFTS